MKIFTLEEANSLLPRVRPVLARIQRTHAALAPFVQDARAAATAADRGGGGFPGANGYVRLLFDLARRTARLDDMGVHLKDYERGLIDFPSIREGKLVLLCWEMGEGDRIEWWHDPEAGYDGRQPL